MLIGELVYMSKVLIMTIIASTAIVLCTVFCDRCHRYKIKK